MKAVGMFIVNCVLIGLMAASAISGLWFGVFILEGVVDRLLVLCGLLAMGLGVVGSIGIAKFNQDWHAVPLFILFTLGGVAAGLNNSFARHFEIPFLLSIGGTFFVFLVLSSLLNRQLTR